METKEYTKYTAGIGTKAEALALTPATTPEMVTQYREYLRLTDTDGDLLITTVLFAFRTAVSADPEADPFVIRFYNPWREKYQKAYLTLCDGNVEWRYHPSYRGDYAQCPPVTCAHVLRLLDGLFAAFYLQAELPESLHYLSDIHHENH